MISSETKEIFLLSASFEGSRPKRDGGGRGSCERKTVKNGNKKLRENRN
jgi:hypothetical protein